MKVCQKVFKTARPKFNSAKQRIIINFAPAEVVPQALPEISDFQQQAEVT